jgi:hypothetical protein
MEWRKSVNPLIEQDWERGGSQRGDSITDGG